MSVALGEADLPLIFNWGPPRPRKRALATFLLLSALAHGFCFYLFQIVYPPTVALLPPGGRATLISPTTEEGRALLRWIESEDPALTLTTMRPPDSKVYALPKMQHVPSYGNWSPVLRDAPDPIPDRSFASVAPPGPVVLPRLAAANIVSAHKTAVLISEEIQSRGQLQPPEFQFETSMLGAPENVRFQVAVNRFGEIRYCLPMNTSGDASLDRQARNFLAQTRFAADPGASDDETWAVATVDWGNDVKRNATSPSP